MEETFARRWNDARASGLLTCVRVCGREFAGSIGLPALQNGGAQRSSGGSANGHSRNVRREVWTACRNIHAPCGIASRPDRLREDVRFAARLLRRQPAFTAVTLAVLALGIGATTVMFSIVNSGPLRPLPFREA